MLPVQAGDPTSTSTATPALVAGAIVPEAPCSFISIITLREEVKDNVHYQLKDILADHVFVGIVDEPRGLSLVQHATKLYMLNHSMLSEELFYQLLLRQFSAYARIGLQPPPPLRRLLRIGLEAEFQRRPDMKKHDIEELENKIAGLLMSRRELLDAHFCMRISEEGELQTLPRLLPGYVPEMAKLPLLVMRLGPQVDWTNEQRCFASIMRELASFYSLTPAPLTAAADAELSKEKEKKLAWHVQHTVLAHARMSIFEPPTSLLDVAVVEVASLPQLYKVFERC